MPLHWIVRLMVSLGLPLFTGMMALSHYQRDATIHVLETTGIVDEIHLKNHNSVTSHYTVNGMTYHLNIGGGHDGIQVYDHIVIYYDAGDPDNAAYDRASLSPYRFVPEFVLALCLGALMYFFWGFRVSGG